MKHYIKSNKEVYHNSIKLQYFMEFIFHDDITGTINKNIPKDVKETIIQYLDEFGDLISDKLVANYPVMVGEIKPNLNHDSIYIPVALLDSSFPGRLRIEIISFANVNRVSTHVQKHDSKDIQQAKLSTQDKFKESLKTRLNLESKINDGTNSLDSSLDKHKKYVQIDAYEFPEDFLINLIEASNDLEIHCKDLEQCANQISEEIYQHLLEINDLIDRNESSKWGRNANQKYRNTKFS